MTEDQRGNLQTASKYINNLLLSRGLLRDGAPIDFAEPAYTKEGADATMSKIMNLVHDMILRRDRETETLTTLSENLQHARATHAHQMLTVSRQEMRNADLERRLAMSVTQQRNVEETSHNVEGRYRVLREELAKLKLTVSQIRSKCINDVRKRDTEIQRLKKHLEGRRGREGNGGQIGVVVVTPEINKNNKRSRDESFGAELESPDYSLKQESTEFLTQLSQNLSNENDYLIRLVRNSISILSTLQGLPDNRSHRGSMHGDSGISDDPNVRIMPPPPSNEKLGADMEVVLESLRSLLTSPTFVSVEELEIREDEIVRLRDGWETMESRWKDALVMMDRWRKRMTETGDTINLDDLNKGLDLGSTIPHIPPRSNLINSPHKTPLIHVGGKKRWEFEGESDIVFKAETRKVLLSPSQSSTSEDQAFSTDLFPPSKALGVSSGNARPTPSPRKVSFEKRPDSHVYDAQDEIALLGSEEKDACSLPDNEDDDQPMSVAEKLQKIESEAKKVQKEIKPTTHETRIPKRKTGRKASRRRSTLSPEELMELMGFA